MPNYRNNAMPYNNYRQTQSQASMFNRTALEDLPLAMAYVPWQTWRNVCDAEQGLSCGTIFQELNMPFTGKGGARR